MSQTEARKTLKDAPIMWRRINSIGIILDCNSTYAKKLGYPKSEILGRTVFEHVPKESWESMNESLKTWFETGQVSNRKITFKKNDGTTFPAVLHATSLYDGKNNLIGSNSVIFDQSEIDEDKIAEYDAFIKNAKAKLEKIKDETYENMDENSKSEYDGLKMMFENLSQINFSDLME